MASYQNFEIKRHQSTDMLPALSDNREYYIVGATNASSADNSIDDSGGPFIQVPGKQNFMLPGQGFKSAPFACSSTDVQIFYYIK